MAVRRPVRFIIGLRRIGRATRPSVAGATRATRQAMRNIENNLARVVSAIEEATPDAIEFALDPIFFRSQELVPVDTGELKDSGFVFVEKRASGARGEVGYAPGGRPFYAVFVHENLEIRHESPTQAKYLEQAVDELSGDIPARIREHLRLQ